MRVFSAVCGGATPGSHVSGVNTCGFHNLPQPGAWATSKTKAIKESSGVPPQKQPGCWHPPASRWPPAGVGAAL